MRPPTGAAQAVTPDGVDVPLAPGDCPPPPDGDVPEMARRRDDVGHQRQDHPRAVVDSTTVSVAPLSSSAPPTSSEDRHEIIRFIRAYEQRAGHLPQTIEIQRYDTTGTVVSTETYAPSDFLPPPTKTAPAKRPEQPTP